MKHYYLGFLLLVACTKSNVNPKQEYAVATKEVTEITSTSAKSGCKLVKGTAKDFDKFGVVWDTREIPLIESNIGKTEDNSEVSLISNLNYDKYFVRAYATRGSETLYGKVISFSTIVSVPTIDKEKVIEVKNNKAVLQATVLGDEVIQKGFVWSKTKDPTIEDLKTENGEATGDFTAEITDLKYATYYVRAYATNKAGTVYGDQLIIETPKSFDIEMIHVEGGSFNMGSTEKQPLDRWGWTEDELPQHEVSVSDFYISAKEITHSQFITFLNDQKIPQSYGYVFLRVGNYYRGSIKYSNGKYSLAREGFENKPIINVTWEGAKAYCEWAGGRLPYEAEWEFAARGGNKTNNFDYSGSNLLSDIGWGPLNSANSLHDVGQKKPNELGIYDMSGNVQEYCADWYDSRYYRTSPKNNPHGPAISYPNKNTKVVRGGHYYNHNDPRLDYSQWKFCRVADRAYFTPGDSQEQKSSSLIGFRLLREF